MVLNQQLKAHFSTDCIWTIGVPMEKNKTGSILYQIYSSWITDINKKISSWNCSTGKDWDIRNTDSYRKILVNIGMRVLIALVGRPEVPEWQEEVKLQEAGFFVLFCFVFFSNPVLSWWHLVPAEPDFISNFELTNALFSWKCLP